MTPVKILHRIAGLIAAAAVVVTTGCAGSAPDVAAYVGPNQISDRDLHEITVAADEVLRTQGQRASSGGVLNGLVLGEIAEQTATQRGIKISDSERDALISPSNLGSLLGNGRTRELAYALADAELVRMRVGDETFLRALGDAEVRLNPRYGTWQPDAYAQGGSMVGAGSESLSLPAPRS
ncbi:hypothetical protein GCM10028864_00900 [Microlunatus parietis]